MWEGSPFLPIDFVQQSLPGSWHLPLPLQLSTPQGFRILRMGSGETVTRCQCPRMGQLRLWAAELGLVHKEANLSRCL